MITLTIIFLIFFEILIFFLVKILKKNFKWIITNNDEQPKFDNERFNNFIKNNFSRELGWDRRPGSKGIENNLGKISHFTISEHGYRNSENNFNNSKISTFGDSYTFCRYVSDNETWQHYLENIYKTHVRNYGVGNYGLDQAFLKFEKTKLEEENKLLIFSIVPETISRIHSYWKHYLEFGNIYSFKPKFCLDKDHEIIKLDNYLIDKKIENIYEKLDYVRENDFFYKNKFLKRMFKFPYTVSFVKSFNFNIRIFYNLIKDLLLRKINKGDENKKFYYEALKLVIIKNIIDADNYYLKDEMKFLLKEVILKYNKIINKLNKKMILLIIPQKYDLLFLKKRNYSKFFKEISNEVDVIDLTCCFSKHKDINSLYIDDKYAGHLSKIGNKLVSDEINKYIESNNIQW